MVFDSDKEIMHIDCGPRWGEDRTLVYLVHIQNKVKRFTHTTSVFLRKGKGNSAQRKQIGRNHGRQIKLEETMETR